MQTEHSSDVTHSSP